MSLPTIQFEGRVNKIDLRRTPAGKPVVNLDIACNSRKFDEQQNKWVDGDVYWINGASAWDGKALAIDSTVAVGDIICGTATLRTRQYEKDGQKRSATDHMIQSWGKVTLPIREDSGQQSPAASGSWGQQQSQPAASWGNQDTSAPF